jgi:predicted DNA-binding transcriptional regulator YafY
MAEPRTSRDGLAKDGVSATPRVRLAAILAHLLERRRATRAELEGLTGASERQVKDDLRALERIGLVLVVGQGRGRAYGVPPALLKAALPTSDRLALVVGLQVTRFLEGTPLHPRDAGLADLEARVRYVPEPYRRYAAHAEVVRTVLDAVLGGRALRVTYRGPRGDKPMDPFLGTNLLVYRRALYVVGRIGDGARVYALALDRILAAELGDPFDAPPFDVDGWLRGRFGLTSDPEHEEPEPISLRFAPDVALLVRERCFHATAEVSDLRDGQVRLTMTATGRELLPFVLQWGSKVVVESPDWLRDAVRDELADALRRYHRPGSGP